ncbi:MAG: hypothetical protein AAFY60_20190, partial [Myxococcota bacterium]
MSTFNPSIADAGDTVNFEVVISHDGDSSADAFNLSWTDTLPAQLSWVPGTPVGGSCAGVVVDESNSSAPGFSISTLALGESCTIEYDLQVENSAESALDYDVVTNLVYESQPVFVSGATRRRNLSTSDALTIFAPTLVKISPTSSLGATGSAQFDSALPDIAIGELVDYEITAVIAEGLTRSVRVVDQLPVGGEGVLELVSATVVSIGAQLSTEFAGTPVLSDALGSDGLNDRLEIEFGEVNNTPDGVNDGGDQIVVALTARMVDNASNQAAQQVTNVATLEYGTALSLDAQALVEVVEPAVELTKSMGAPVEDRVRVNVTVANEGSSPAYEIEVQDVLDHTVWSAGVLDSVQTPDGFSVVTSSDAEET